MLFSLALDYFMSTRIAGDCGFCGPGLDEPMVTLALVIARSEKGVIGHQGRLPWHISADLRHFKRLTVGKPVIMGRKTYESIGRPLPRRANIVVTRDPQWQKAGVSVAHDLPSALALAYEEAHRTGSEEVMVIGGAEIYRQALDQATRIYLTEVHGDFPGDVMFDINFTNDGWREVSRDQRTSENPEGPSFSFVTLERNR